MFLKNKIFLNFKSFVPLCLCGILFFPHKIFSQQSVVPLNQEWIQETEAMMVKDTGFFLNPKFAEFDTDTTLRTPNDLPSIANDKIVVVAIHSSMRPWNENGHPLRKNI